MIEKKGKHLKNLGDMNTMIEEIRKRIKARMDNTDAAGDYDEYADGIVVGLSYALGIIDDIEKEHPVHSDVQEAAEKWAATTHFEWPNQVPAGKKGFAAGMLAERERLMKGAVEIDTDITINRYTKQHILHISSTDEHIQHLPQGEYKAIIIKKEK